MQGFRDIERQRVKSLVQKVPLAHDADDFVDRTATHQQLRIGAFSNHLEDRVPGVVKIVRTARALISITPSISSRSAAWISPDFSPSMISPRMSSSVT